MTEEDCESSTSKCCLICSAPSNASAHFGATACLACAAFFRRTVSLEIQFQCSAQSECRVYYEQRITCKACRYAKCISAGMKPQCVQKRKVVRKKESLECEIVKTEPGTVEPRPFGESGKGVIECSRECTYEFTQSKRTSIVANTSTSGLSSVSSSYLQSPATVPSSDSNRTGQVGSTAPGCIIPELELEQSKFANIREMNVLDHFVDEERRSCERRRVMFSNSPLNALLDLNLVVPFSIEELVPFTVKSHNTHMRFDHLLAFEYTKNLPGFTQLSPTDRVTIFRYAVMSFCALDIAFLTCQMNMTERGLIVFTNATYSSIHDLSAGWDNEDDLTTDDKKKLIWPMNQTFFYGLIKPMAEINLDRVEYSALKALTLWRTCYFELTPTAKLLAKEHEYGIIKGLHRYYQGHEDGPERMGGVILFIGNIFELYQTIIENYKKIELFNLIKIDMFVRELLQL